MVAFSRIALLSLVLGTTLASASDMSPGKRSQGSDDVVASTTPEHILPSKKSDDGNRKHRQVSYNLSPNKLDVRSKLTNETSFRFSMRTKPVPTFRAFSYHTDTSADSEFEFTYAVALLKVVEVNGTIAWNQSTSGINFFTNLRSWSPLAVANETVALADGSNGTLYSVSSSFATLDGATVNIAAYLSPSEVKIPGGGNLRPNGIKYSLDVENFNYKYENSSLALIKAIYAEHERELANKTETVSLGEVGAFNWNSTVDLFNGSVKSTGTIQAEPLVVVKSGDYAKEKDEDDTGKEISGDPTNGRESAQLIIFKISSENNSHIHASKISWDPQLSVDASYDATSSALRSRLMAFSSLIVIASTILLI